MVVYIASRSPLPLVPWQEEARAFNVAELNEHEEIVRRHLAFPHVCQAGSHTSCGCGFNEAREYPEMYDSATRTLEQADALESSYRLARYVREHRVQEIYSCWSGDEGQPQNSKRHITPDVLVVGDFFFRERELLVIDHNP